MSEKSGREAFHRPAFINGQLAQVFRRRRVEEIEGAFVDCGPAAADVFRASDGGEEDRDQQTAPSFVYRKVCLFGKLLRGHRSRSRSHNRGDAKNSEKK